MEDWQHGGFGLYLHWPFCAAKCPYCDFNSHVRARVDQAAWENAFLSEIGRAGIETEGRRLDTVFFGGGTPSLMEPDLVASIIDRIRRTWPTSNSLEITLEANPTSVEAGRFRAYRDAGVNRVSMGIQALNDADLKALGRLHSVKEAQSAFEVAQAHFERVSFDLIYARQGQTLEAWIAELRAALSMAIDHLSLYQLTVEPGTAFGDRAARGMLRGLPDGDLGADMFEATQDLCSDAGMPAYEVSNHAAEGCESRHNLIYWRYGDYVGIGPGAHGRLTLSGQKWATSTPLHPEAWLAQVQDSGHGETPRQLLTPNEISEELLLMGLRLSEGVSLNRITAIAGAPLPERKLSELQEAQLIRVDGDRLRTTLQGRMVLNAILRELLSEDR
ncbi:oxygen-independent coproporphyrinogen III oxidase [Dinoroseobacter shibae DFL 12 = DSM 16493]|jgi:oxygen-independent coproporphyrinogen-3 oxidase|uniref:Heme chaperone HemW n=1 Tax=Dinoroseobacter shibae (strain DSM 16493 / NCIMB 14021 / DFL 12) TaxID=398580 RepID=A8LPC8_DINSH|nr:radical SAM family heme chaperone HemW [Dinoroseobacter shibae]ABV95193.1 oxygen-independent coproporphyrinogen III oxidase [Dinoroseobacter shibae DFL 12 = DSM 16493]URF46606.1 radical SAM family heme chaperone HemW [Dinoroseobacter shibae]URF50912.1 radical SAM family heme chaperone HemW [Dinoroseobacter shibae]